MRMLEVYTSSDVYRTGAKIPTQPEKIVHTLLKFLIDKGKLLWLALYNRTLPDSFLFGIILQLGIQLKDIGSKSGGVMAIKLYNF